MRATYAVIWREGNEPAASGRLEIRPHSIAFTGAGEGRVVERELPLNSLRSVHVGRSPQDRIDGRSSLVIEPRCGGVIRVAGVAQPGIVSELAQRIGSPEPAPGRRILVALPLKPGATGRARELIASGPPFEPEETGLARHRVFLLEDEALFLFEADTEDEQLESVLSRPDVWAAADAWRELAAGPPRLAEDVYDWDRPVPGRANGHADSPSQEPGLNGSSPGPDAPQD